MTDESLHVRVHDTVKGTVDTKIVTMRDLYTLLSDRMDLEIFRIERRVDYTKRLQTIAIIVLFCGYIGLMGAVGVLAGVFK